MTPTTIIIIE